MHDEGCLNAYVEIQRRKKGVNIKNNETKNKIIYNTLKYKK